MAFIARGWARSENNSASNCETGNSAQGILLRGMYQIRAAQYIRPNRIVTRSEYERWDSYIQALNESASTFDRGIAVARQMQSPIVQLPDRQENLNILRLLQFGRAVMAPGCSQLTADGSRRVPGVPVEPEILSAGTPFYDRYGVLDCAATQSP